MTPKSELERLLRQVENGQTDDVEFIGRAVVSIVAMARLQMLEPGQRGLYSGAASDYLTGKGWPKQKA